MKPIFNPSMLLTVIGILQPATAGEVEGFLRERLPAAGAIPSASELLQFLRQRTDMGQLVRLKRGDVDLYSLTAQGNRYLSVVQRKFRDKHRLYLLREAHSHRLVLLGEEPTRLVGASPTIDDRQDVKGSAGRSYGPRASRQFDSTGSSASSPNNFPKMLSFSAVRQAELALGVGPGEFEFTMEGLALCMGVSAKLISQVCYRTDRHYRRFEIKKRGGGKRTIESPRIFLKVIQWFLNDFVLNDLPVHRNVHSFRGGRSIVSNAEVHVGQGVVANIDLKDFFGSITAKHITELLAVNGFGEREAWAIAQVCTKNDALPQGAPTSPTLSNAILYEFDRWIARYCERRDIVYSRYADDITFSGSSRTSLAEVIASATKNLRKLGFRINPDKTRMASTAAQQVVTGVVVNEVARPSRLYRRRVRAAIHQATISQSVSAEKMSELRGHIAYFSMFPAMQESSELVLLQSSLEQIISSKSSRSKPPPKR